MPAVVPIAPIAVAAKRNRIVRHFTTAAARSPETARTLSELKLTQGHIFRHMIRDGIIREEAGEKFWLDEAANAARGRRVMVYIAVALGVSVVIIVAMVLISR